MLIIYDNTITPLCVFQYFIIFLICLIKFFLYKNFIYSTNIFHIFLSSKGKVQEKNNKIIPRGNNNSNNNDDPKKPKSKIREYIEKLLTGLFLLIILMLVGSAFGGSEPDPSDTECFIDELLDNKNSLYKVPYETINYDECNGKDNITNVRKMRLLTKNVIYRLDNEPYNHVKNMASIKEKLSSDDFRQIQKAVNDHLMRKLY